MINGSTMRHSHRGRRVATFFASALGLAVALGSCVSTNNPIENAPGTGASKGRWPSGDPQTGKDLFVNKGCFICHSVNHVGGRAALPLDAPPDGREVDPLVFAAAMWEGASAMLSLQFTELGYQIGVTGNELRNLAAFASDLETQGTFSLDDIPAIFRPWIIDAPHWQDEDWPEPFESLPDGATSPFEDL